MLKITEPRNELLKIRSLIGEMKKTIEVGLQDKDKKKFQKVKHSDKGIENWKKKRHKKWRSSP